jgi:hypothetical protein
MLAAKRYLALSIDLTVSSSSIFWAVSSEGAQKIFGERRSFGAKWRKTWPILYPVVRFSKTSGAAQEKTRLLLTRSLIRDKRCCDENRSKNIYLGLDRDDFTKLAEAMIDDLYRDWKAHGIQAIRETRETSPADYLRIVAMIISKCDVNLADDMHDAALEQFIEERRQKALLTIAKMRE